MTTARSNRDRLRHALAITLLSAAAVLGDDRPRALPALTLADPRGTRHRLDALGDRPLILVVTAPIAEAESAQRGWDEALRAARPADATGRVVFLEDLSQSWFPSIARKAMEDAFDPAGTLVLVDEDGRARRALEVATESTVVLVFERGGRLAARHREAPGRASAAAAWREASAE